LANNGGLDGEAIGPTIVEAGTRAGRTPVVLPAITTDCHGWLDLVASSFTRILCILGEGGGSLLLRLSAGTKLEMPVKMEIKVKRLA
jgi:hypothetical protein